ncbi:MAG: NUDIX hydrolase [Actinomycetota bacterium]|nr:NUDIX hydrolase [Actinomycetota bacterium]
MERLESETVYEGKIVDVRTDTFRYADGKEAEREIVAHPGAVGMVAHGDGVVWLVRQPREAVNDPELLEVPAGKLDEEGETRLQCAQRELREEVGLEAAHWAEWKRFFTSPGFAEEEVTVFEATGLSPIEDFEPDPEERIQIVKWPLADLGGAIEACRDSKSLIALHMLRARTAAPEGS